MDKEIFLMILFFLLCCFVSFTVILWLEVLWKCKEI
jgi:hypothetical protein